MRLVSYKKCINNIYLIFDEYGNEQLRGRYEQYKGLLIAINEFGYVDYEEVPFNKVREIVKQYKGTEINYSLNEIDFRFKSEIEKFQAFCALEKEFPDNLIVSYPLYLLFSRQIKVKKS